MVLLSLFGLMSAAATNAAQAESLAAAHAWEDLYLAFAAPDPKAFNARDQVVIAHALESGCLAIVETDAALAYSLGERSAAFHATANALLCNAQAAQATEQPAEAERTLRKGLVEFPKDGRFALTLGRQLLQEQDIAGAVKALELVPRKSPQFEEAKGLLVQARFTLAEVNKAAAPRTPRLSTPGVAAAETGPATTANAGYESSSGPEGTRTRSNRRFVFKYFNNGRDFGQRAEYEGKFVGAMDEAYEFTQRVLGRARERPCEVLLYTRAEFAVHFSQAAAMRVAGLYSGSALRLNDAAEIDSNGKAVLTHEYVHAVVDEVAGFKDERVPLWLNEGLAEYVEWRFTGSDGPSFGLRTTLRTVARQGHLPSLAVMEHSPPINTGNAAVAYATCATAVKLLMAKGQIQGVLDLIRDVGEGQALEPSLMARFGLSVAKLQEEVQEELNRP